MDEDMNGLIPNLVGLWIECCKPNCKKWRYVSDIDDPLMVPEKWYCTMNPDTSANTCSAPERLELAENEVFVESKFKAGSIVWAKIIGHPWCPAMVDFCPDFESFYWFDKRDSNVPTQYHVKFFAEKNVTRAWIKSDFIKPFVGNDEKFALKAKVCGKKLTVAQQGIIIKNCKIAKSAMSLSITQRLKKYSHNSWKLIQRLQKESDNSQRRSTASHSPPRSETPARSKTVSDKKTRKCSKSELPISTKATDKKPKRNTNQIKIISPTLASADKSSQKYSRLTVSFMDTWSSGTTRTYNDTSSSSCVSFETEVSSNYSVREICATGRKKRHVMKETGREKKIVFEDNETVIESSQQSKLESELQILDISFRETGNGKEFLNNMVENEETRADEFPDWIPSSPQPGPSRLSLKIKSMNEKMKRNSGSESTEERRSLSERMSRNENKENNSEESKYLKTLSKLSESIDESEINKFWSHRSRSSLSKRKLPDFDLIQKKLLELQDQSVDKLLSDVSDELDKKIRRGSSENIITEYSSQVGTSSKAVKTAAKIRDRSAMIVNDSITSDESFTSASKL